MRRMIIAALTCAVAALTGCSSATDKPATKATQSEPSASATFDKNSALREAWEGARDTYSASLKLDICEASKKGGQASVKAILTDSEQMPFVVEHPDYDAGQWVTYCAGN